MLLIERVGKQIKTNVELLTNENVMFYIAPIININELRQELKEIKGIDFNKTADINYYYTILVLEMQYFKELQDIYKNDVVFKDNELFLITNNHKHLLRLLIRECNQAKRILKTRKKN